MGCLVDRLLDVHAVRSFPSLGFQVTGTGSAIKRPLARPKKKLRDGGACNRSSVALRRRGVRVRERLRVAVGAGESPVGYLEGVQAHRLDGRLLVAGERVGDDRLPGEDEGGHPSTVAIGWISPISPILAHQAAYLGGLPVVAELLQSWWVV